MCFRRKTETDPRVAREQELQRTEIESAKKAEREKVSKAKAEALEQARAEANRTAAVNKAAKRQREMQRVVKERKSSLVARRRASSKNKPPAATPSMTASNLSRAETDSPETPDVVRRDPKVKSTAAEREARIAKFGEVATANRRGRRSGSRGRRSLITGIGGGIGYFNRFGG
tara:strand:+ start:368 stop:886 length:519 start_codon:yes stop_codon:yes gene_type:complete